MRLCGKVLYSGAGHRWQGACVLHARYPRLQTHTHTYSVCIILFVFPLQQCLHEHDSILRYTYIDCLVSTSFERGPATQECTCPSLGKNLKIPSRYKLESWIRNHSRTQFPLPHNSAIGHLLMTAAWIQHTLCRQVRYISTTKQPTQQTTDKSVASVVLLDSSRPSTAQLGPLYPREKSSQYLLN